MTTGEVADKLVELCSKGAFDEVVDNYYADDIVSIEPVGGEGMPARMEGLDAVKGKNQWWIDNHEVHAVQVDGPFVGDGDQFAVRFQLDVTPKMTGQRMKMVEMALYTVRDGKIAQEEFYYYMPAPPQ